MALILQNNHYVKLDAEGNFVIYKNKTARNRLKKITSDEVIEFYRNKIHEFYTDDSSEKAYYGSETDVSEAQAWSEEFSRYCINLANRDRSGKYPLASEYIKNINDSIPEILSTGNIGLKFDTVDEVYLKVKELEIFGPAEDLKDA